MNLVSKNNKPDLYEKIRARLNYVEKNCGALPKIDSGIQKVELGMFPHTTRNTEQESNKWGNTINFDENRSSII